MKRKLYTSIGATLFIAFAALIASVSIFAADSGWKSPTSNTNSGVTNPQDAYSQNGTEATFGDNGDAAVYYDFSFGVPAGARIDGIEVRVDAYKEYRGNSDLSVRLYDGATVVGNSKTIDSADLSSSESNNYITLGTTSDLWGATWDSTKANNLRVRLSVNSNDNLYVDHVQVKITYTERYDVTFREGAHGSLAPNPNVGTVLKGGNATAPTPTADYGYEFDKWVLTSDLTTEVAGFNNITANKDVTALYKKCNYPVVFLEGPNGTLVGDNQAGDEDLLPGSITRIVPYLDDVVVPGVTSDLGWKFIGWARTDLLPTGAPVQETLYQSDDPIFTEITEAMAFVARYAQIDYTVTFESNGGTIVASQVLHYGDKVVEPASAPFRDGYTFGGWYKEASLTTAWNFSTDAVAGNTTLYAKWTPVATLPKTGEFGTLIAALGTVSAGAGVLAVLKKKDEE